MLTGIHILLTYACNLKCEHCFLHCGPGAKGTFTLEQVRTLLDELTVLGTVETVYFEGGEPFLFYPVMLAGIRLARKMGFKTGIVTNGYWATCDRDAELWLRPLAELEVSRVSVSDDPFHFGEAADSPARRAVAAADRLGVPAGTICIERPTVEISDDAGREKGTAVVGGGVMFRGRAVETLTEGLPRRLWGEFTECPHEDLRDPSRVHVDAYGNVHLCQGLSMGNAWRTPLSAMVRGYDPDAHPICGPLLRGGPARLVREYDIAHEDAYVDACHLCYCARLALLDRFSDILTPRQVYGLT